MRKMGGNFTSSLFADSENNEWGNTHHRKEAIVTRTNLNLKKSHPGRHT